jgi:hypothetical protein
MLLGEPRLDRKAFELHIVSLERVTGGSGERPAQRRGPRVQLGNPLEMDLDQGNARVGGPRGESAIVPIADGRRKYVKLGRLELLELASGAFLTGNTCDKPDVCRALHVTEQGDEALHSRRGDVTGGCAERIEKRYQVSPGSTDSLTSTFAEGQTHLPARLHLGRERRGREVRGRNVEFEVLLVVDLPVKDPELGVLHGARLRTDNEAAHVAPEPRVLRVLPGRARR